MNELLGGFYSPKGPMWGARSTVRNDFGVLVGQHERAGKGPAVRGAWEWQGRCPSLMYGACSGQLPFVFCFQLGRHVWGAGLALHEDWAGREGERQVSAPSLAAESRCLREEEGGKGGHGRFARHQSSWELLERRHMACVGRLTS